MRTFNILTCLLLAASPFAGATHAPGLPKNFCEDPTEWSIHIYALLTTAPKPNKIATRGAEGFGSLQRDGTGVSFSGALADGNVAGDCNGDTVPSDFDGHSEYTFGGAWIITNSGDGVTSGSVACFGETGHHPTFGPFRVIDDVLGNAIRFHVGSDYLTMVPPTDPAEPNCGDFQTDEEAECYGTCLVTFPEGIDGAYVVYVGDYDSGSVGGTGHVTAP